MASYELFLCNDRGRRLMPLTNLSNFAASKICNGIGAFTAELRPPADLATLQNYHYIERNIQPDWTVQVWSKARGPMRLWRSYFVLSWSWSQSSDGDEVFAFGGYDPNHLLTRRIVAAYAASAQAKMAGAADDMLRQVVRDSIEDDALPVPTAGTRAWADLRISGNLAQGPGVELEFAWNRLLTLSGGGLLEQIAQAARENGTEVFWAIVEDTISTNGVTYQFKTNINQPRRDLTTGNGKVVFDGDAGTLQDWSLEYDYSEEVNYVYSLGQGEDALREVQQVSDEARYKRSYWGRCEGKIEARMMTTAAAVQDAGYDALAEGRPVVRMRGVPISRAGTEYGRHYDVGDKVIVRAKGKQFDAIVWSAVVSMGEDGKTSEAVRLEYRA